MGVDMPGVDIAGAGLEPPVVVVLVNWNGGRHTVECLESLVAIDYGNARVVVCDNASADDSAERVHAWAVNRCGGLLDLDRAGAETHRAPAPWLTWVRTGANLGFAGGCNVGLRFALAQGAAYAWLLNNDTVVEPDALRHLVRRMAGDPGVGACGSTLRQYHDRSMVQAMGGAYFQRWSGFAFEIGRGRRLPAAADLPPAGDVEARLSYVTAASMLVSRAYLETVGLMAEDYFLYFEEVDWAVRAGSRFRLGYAPRSVVYHKEGATMGSGDAPRRSLAAEFYALRARLLFTRRHYPYALPTVYLGTLALIARRLQQGDWSKAWLLSRVALGKRTLP